MLDLIYILLRCYRGIIKGGYRYVTLVLNGVVCAVNDDTGVLQVCYRYILLVWQECFKESYRGLYGCYIGVYRSYRGIKMPS